MELPALEGSEKQIQWAQDIRATVLSTINFATVLRGVTAAETAERSQAIIERVKARITGMRAARWWINNRYALQNGGRPALTGYTPLDNVLRDDVPLGHYTEQEYIREYGDDFDRVVGQFQVGHVEVSHLEAE